MLAMNKNLNKPATGDLDFRNSKTGTLKPSK